MKCSNKGCENYTEYNANHCSNLSYDNVTKEYTKYDLTKCKSCIPLYTYEEVEGVFENIMGDGNIIHYNKTYKSFVKDGFLLATKHYGLLDSEGV